ncbi:MAG: glyoxylate-induced protein, partial [Saccharofermentanales bacterium]
MKISVCIDALFNGKDFIESMRAVKGSGISAFEFWVWWTKDLPQIKKAKEELGMELVGFCTKF